MPNRRIDIRALRSEMGITRRQLAKQIPLSVRTIERHEGQHNTSEISAMAKGHLDRLLAEHRAKNKGQAPKVPADPRKAPHGNRKMPSRDTKSTSSGPTRQPIVRSFGRA